MALGGVLAVGVPHLAGTMAREEEETLARRLRAEARGASEMLPWASGPALDSATARVAAALGVRLTILASDGRVLADSSGAVDRVPSPADRPEVAAALTSGEGWHVDPESSGRMLAVAVRERRDDETRIVRATLSMPPAALRGAARMLVAATLPAGLLGLAMALGLARRFGRRLERLVDFARHLAAGEPAPYLAPERADDLGVLEGQLADMARSVEATIAALRIEQDRLEAILSGMVEGVLVTDLAGTVVLLNERAHELLGVVGSTDGRGRPLVELTRDPAMHDLARELRAGAAVLTRDVTLSSNDGRTLQVNAARLTGIDGRAFGFVLVLHDVTELRRLEVVRRDFVANVSHELRTPLTAIKGYAETLLGPAGDDRDTARRFLAVIDRHSERLGRLTDDLLTLSDLELGRAALHLAPVAVAPAIEDVLQILGDRAARAQVKVASQVRAGTPPVMADGDRLRQVLINLIDNAVKYTPAGGAVVARAAPGDDGMVEIAIQDTGIGIPVQDLPRLTERFFRVDKARSRALGGTGLGLAIVKHIVQAHGGRLDITSTAGQGTTVEVAFPAARPEPAAPAGPPGRAEGA